MLFVAGYKNASIYSDKVKSVLQILLLIYFIVRLMRDERNFHLVEIPFFLIAIIKLTMSAVGIIMDMLKPYLMYSRLLDELVIAYCIYFVIYGLLTALLTIPIWKSAQNPKYARLQI